MFAQIVQCVFELKKADVFVDVFVRRRDGALDSGRAMLHLLLFEARDQQSQATAGVRRRHGRAVHELGVSARGSSTVSFLLHFRWSRIGAKTHLRV